MKLAIRIPGLVPFLTPAVVQGASPPFSVHFKPGPNKCVLFPAPQPSNVAYLSGCTGSADEKITYNRATKSIAMSTNPNGCWSMSDSGKLELRLCNAADSSQQFVFQQLGPSYAYIKLANSPSQCLELRAEGGVLTPCVATPENQMYSIEEVSVSDLATPGSDPNPNQPGGQAPDLTDCDQLEALQVNTPALRVRASEW
ncbi:hypothetical protein Poli38472_013159 [Pythium oligandrum]|uniref:Uncharacterized protein n=1 Tax=Pythium oligandrum TaxID=41045 RepID=A0A8K1C2P0_PYTOL|nr:hypothetical protein Poli38472_013159 [Pythium oligandrum]|eukprot:TMW55268.1 hypothetical protein Poli38472_013159 [Pythium oligandrum]